MKIAVVVHGRFHAFDLVRELIPRGHDVLLLTNYPKWAVAKFGVSGKNVRSLWLHGAVTRMLRRLQHVTGAGYPEALVHRWFGAWAASELAKEDWDVILCWSGVGEEIFRAFKDKPALKVCHRSSSHIRVQSRLLEEEERRTGAALMRPCRWIIEREEREYQAADSVHVPSTFAKESFAAMGVPASKVALIPHGVNTAAFRAPTDVVEARCRRILSGQPLQVLNIGTFSLRKGMWDFKEIVGSLHRENFRFTFVGPPLPEAKAVMEGLGSKARFIPAQPQRDLPRFYAEGDLFVLPTIEDGFPFVLAQASAACLPILTTPNGAGTDLVQEQKNGWVLPVRSPGAFIDRLRWCDAHRKELAEMVRWMSGSFTPRGWEQVAADFEKLCLQAKR